MLDRIIWDTDEEKEDLFENKYVILSMEIHTDENEPSEEEKTV